MFLLSIYIVVFQEHVLNCGQMSAIGRVWKKEIDHKIEKLT